MPTKDTLIDLLKSMLAALETTSTESKWKKAALDMQMQRNCYKDSFNAANEKLSDLESKLNDLHRDFESISSDIDGLDAQEEREPEESDKLIDELLEAEPKTGPENANP